MNWVYIVVFIQFNRSKNRIKTFNKAALPDLGGVEYKLVLEHYWDTARQAYAMEQSLLEHFKKKKLSRTQKLLSASARLTWKLFGVKKFECERQVDTSNEQNLSSILHKNRRRKK